ncbi:DUF2627 domain-containing protein [Brevibacillus laterosporus]|uniref:DUF2627 domain-containing protein n=2 Tax=Brevibacillus TaxID=55080 RepID=A0A0F6Y0D5_BRELA|nr:MULTISPECIES: DUF2627 domain-containing protein [Brevibacillus]AKF95336.1 hypothetical protein EX87_17045 [Brevibacillus laterosporus]MCR8985182.1 DUF2627 domain-containing protein [Brevibacillus laterosporus]MCZ0830911.1 DUF2627 domain-containing protein [Brevibacillus halotolerans]
MMEINKPLQKDVSWLLGQRIVALLIMVIPAVIAGWGFKIMRDTLYQYFNPDINQFMWGYFTLGAFLFVVPIAFIGGFILHHDRKRNRVQPRFMKRDPDEDDE